MSYQHVKNEHCEPRGLAAGLRFGRPGPPGDKQSIDFECGGEPTHVLRVVQFTRLQSTLARAGELIEVYSHPRLAI